MALTLGMALAKFSVSMWYRGSLHPDDQSLNGTGAGNIGLLYVMLNLHTVTYFWI